MGLRKANDTDHILRSYLENHKPNSSHNQYEYLFCEDIDSLLDNPNDHFYLLGQKILSTHVIKAFKKARNEPKDIKDVILLEANS